MPESLSAGDSGIPDHLRTTSSVFEPIDGVAPDGPIDEVFDHDAFDTKMDAAKLMATLLEAANPEQAGPMSDYMRGQFPFLGIKTDERRKLTKPFFREARGDAHADWSFVSGAWAYPFREFQYAAIDYLQEMVPTMSGADLPRLRTLIESKSWWDSVDALRKVVTGVVGQDSNATSTMLDWAEADNLWTRRVAITYQLGLKDNTDTELLARIVRTNFGTDEFFINKAIGWALRDYSKTSPEWARAFISTHSESMDALAVREASKYL